MKKLKRAAALALAAAMLLCFAACGEDTPGAQETETPDFVYVASYSPVELHEATPIIGNQQSRIAVRDLR